VDFSLNDEQEALQKMAHDFAQQGIKPIAKEIDQAADSSKSFPWETIKKGLSLGLGQVLIPEKYGGLGKGLLESALVIEELAWGDAGIATTIGTSSDLGGLLSEALSEKQKGKWLPEICHDSSNSFLLAGGYTEPSGGTEILCFLDDPGMGVRTTANRKGDEYIINGVKSFTTNISVAKLYLVLVRTDKSKPNAEGCSLFLIPADTQGLKVGRIENKMGLRSALNGSMYLNDVHVSAENMVGPENEGLTVVDETFRGASVTVGATCIGLARAAYETALAYSDERKIWGQKIRQYGTVAHKLAEMRTKIEAARSLVWRISWAIENADSSRGLYKLASMAKVFPAKMVREVTIDAVQIMGAYGYMKDYEAEKFVRDAMAMPIMDITNEVLNLLMSEEL
jgi:acyl-CoA dehydrogenase